jgi:AGZA family xanthine/uracil permease-like MFS transporter
MLWGGFLAELIDRRLKRSAVYLFILALLTFFGITHSASPDGLMYLPWTLTGASLQIPYQFGGAYALLGLLLLALSATTREQKTVA